MVIVANAEAVVKVDKYFISKNNPELAGAVAGVMALFKIEADSKGGTAAGNNQPSAQEDASFRYNILVENELNYYDEENSVKVKTKIYFQPNKDKEARSKPALNDEQPNFLETENQTSLSSKEDALVAAKRLTRLNVFVLMKKITGTNPSPWGILRGVRPTKIVHRLLDEGLDKQETINALIKDYGIDNEKARLITDISVYQRSLSADAKPSKNTVSVYIGIPYCPSRCLYCSFPSYALPLKRSELEAFLEALKTDIAAASMAISRTGLKVETIYIGGGTPTSLKAKDFGWLLELVNKNFFTEFTKEFTVEAGRPDSIDAEKIAELKHSGVNRISINPQTMQDETLRLIGRRHTVEDIINAFHKIRQAEIKIINMDIIAGLPGETEAQMIDTMSRIEKLSPENVTVHTLAIKRGSLLKNDLIQQPENKNLKLPDEITTGNMLEIVSEYAGKMGMKPYYLYRQKYMTGNLENVGYAKPGTQCFYNIQIIGERQSIIGIGPAAGTKAVNPNSWRLQSCYNPKDVSTYVNNLQTYINARDDLLYRL